MELMKTKYKQTEVGLIPEDWKIISMSEITNLMTNGFVGTATSHYSEEIDSVLYIQGYNVKENSFNFNGIKSVSLEFHKRNKKSCLQEGDLLTVQTGDVGLTTIVPKELEGSNCHALIISRFNKKIAYPWYYAQYFNSFQGRSRLKELETGTTMKHINVGELVHWKVPLPPTLTEQKAIATALSDVDELINSLERLITKKKAIKQGAMQELLTPPQKGGKRLPMFSGDWEEKKLGELTELITKGTTPTSIGKEFTNQGIKFIKAESIDKTGSIINDKVAFIDAETHELLGRSKMKKDDILFTIAGVLGRIGVIKEYNLPSNTNQAVAIVRLKKSLNLFVPFFFHILRTNAIERHIESISVQGAQANFSLADVSNIPLSVPVSLEEQKAIAQILSDMDLEIGALEAKKAKYQGIKQGMMQGLLTGKTRLV